MAVNLIDDDAPVRTAVPTQLLTATNTLDFQTALAMAQAEVVAPVRYSGLRPGPVGPGGDGSQTGTVKKNRQGQVIEVDFPNGKHRQFGYDKSGALDRVVQPDGTVIQLVNGKWEFGPNKNQPDFYNPRVSSDGTLSYQTIEGAYVNDFNDGTQTTINSDLTIVTQDANGNITEVNYQNGSNKQFSYDAKGNITQIVDNGKTYTVDHSGKIIGPDGKPTGETNPFVFSNGDYSYQDQNNNLVTIHPDKSQFIVNINTNATITKNPAGQITSIGYSEGVSPTAYRIFGYDSDGQLNSITDTDGKKYTYARPLGEWVDANGKPAYFSDPNVSADGTYSYTDANNKVVFDYTNGRSSTTTQTTEQISQAAVDIHTALSSSRNQSVQINAILNKMSPADAAQLEEQYQNMYGVSLSSDLASRLSSDTAGQQILTGDDVRAAAVKSLLPRDINKNGSYTVEVNGGPYKGWSLSSLHVGPGQDVVSLYSPNGQLTEVDRPDGSKVELTYDDPHDANWHTVTDSRTGVTYLRTQGAGIEEIGKNGQLIVTLGNVWVNADGTITINVPTKASQLLKFDAGVSPAVAQQVTEEIDNLPPNIQQMLLEDNVSIEITPDKQVHGLFGGNYDGYLLPNLRQIVIAGGSSDVEETVAHEVAHAVDAYNLHITSSPGFQAAINRDLKNGLPKDFNSYKGELGDPPNDPKYGFGEGDLYAEITAGLLGYDQSGMPAAMMKDFPTTTAYIKHQLGLDTPAVG